MSSSSLNLGIDFLYARVHGWWARSAHGELLDNLTRAATEENFFHQLQAAGIISITNPERVLEQLILRQYDRLGQLGEYLGGAFQKYMHTLQDSLERENFKAILNYRFFPERETKLTDTFVRFPGHAIHEKDLMAMLEAPDTEQFIRMIPEDDSREELAEITRQLAKDKDIMRAECAVDNLSFRRELAAVRHLWGEMKDVLLKLQGCEMDCINIITLLRNANFYHLDAKGLSYAWLEGGQELSRELFDRLATVHNPQEVLASLPTTYRSVFPEGLSGAKPGSLNNLLYCKLAHQAKEIFYDSVHPRRALAAYPMLLYLETINLSRIYEGIRFSLPPRDIAALMIR